MDEEKREEKEEINEPVKEETKPVEQVSNDLSKPKKSLTDSLRGNPFILSTVVCGILALMLLIVVVSGNGMTGNMISEEQASENVLEFASSQLSDMEILSVEEENGLYKIEFTSTTTGDSSIYSTLDGEYLVNGLIALDVPEVPTTETTTEVPKSDSPEVGLYIWSYCPYGVTALSPFAQVASLLEDYAGFRVYLYYAGHGDYEVQQNKIQACIQELEYNYWEYSEIFATEIYNKCSGDIACDLNESIVAMDSLGIDSTAVLDCVESEGDALLEEDYDVAQGVGVTGSPSLVINGIIVGASRTAEAYKDAVCSSFTDAPEECDSELDATGTTSSGSC